ncbi:polyvinylalcohol dehydrogenase [Bacteroidia bacterium]|nr:polyvinylalcohol dehydrogenase [Bacteroidia bacterium]
MNTMKRLGLTGIYAIVLCLYSHLAVAQTPFGWRGAARDGIYHETGLLKSWPEGGPQLLWENTEVGKGFSSPMATNGKVYINGLDKDGEKEFITAFSLDGKVLWKTTYGSAWENTYPDSRSTPTVVGNDLYVESGKPELVCLDVTTGAIQWSVDAVELYNRKPTEFGPVESPLVVGDVVYFTIMSNKASLVALNRKNGEVIWETPPFKGDLMYASPIFIEYHGKKQIVIINEFYATGIDQSTGAIAWQANIFDFMKAGMQNNNWRPQFTNTPLYKDGKICVACGYDYGAVMLQLNDDATGISQAWLNRDLDPHHGGMVLVDGYLYGSTWTNNNVGNWGCVDWNTGKTMYENPWTGGNKGTLIYADGMLYCYDDRRGNIGLAKATPEKFDLVSTFRITKGEGPNWAHLAIHNGILFVRHGNALMAYKIK